MSQEISAPSRDGPPDTIVVIRHGEKPTAPDAEPFGVDVDGRRYDGSLTPKGWQRAGALAVLFRSGVGPLPTPDHLHAPKYRSHRATLNHRTYQTLLPLSLQLDRPIRCHFAEDEEQRLANAIIGRDAGTTLVCWDHHRIPKVASYLPVANPEMLPAVWPDDRYDMIWLFTRDRGSPLAYTFAQLPQLLLFGDTHI